MNFQNFSENLLKHYIQDHNNAVKNNHLRAVLFPPTNALNKKPKTEKRKKCGLRLRGGGGYPSIFPNNLPLAMGYQTNMPMMCYPGMSNNQHLGLLNSAYQCSPVLMYTPLQNICGNAPIIIVALPNWSPEGYSQLSNYPGVAYGSPEDAQMSQGPQYQQTAANTLSPEYQHTPSRNKMYGGLQNVKANLFKDYTESNGGSMASFVQPEYVPPRSPRNIAQSYTRKPSLSPRNPIQIMPRPAGFSSPSESNIGMPKFNSTPMTASQIAAYNAGGNRPKINHLVAEGAGGGEFVDLMCSTLSGVSKSHVTQADVANEVSKTGRSNRSSVGQGERPQMGRPQQLVMKILGNDFDESKWSLKDLSFGNQDENDEMWYLIENLPENYKKLFQRRMMLIALKIAIKQKQAEEKRKNRSKKDEQDDEKNCVC